MYSKRHLLLLLLAAILPAAGCQKLNTENAHLVRLEPYEKLSYETAEAVRQDIRTEYTLELVAKEYVKRNYAPMYDDMQIDTVYVSVGDHVEKGDLLISFRSEDFSEKIKEYRTQMEELSLLAEHYKKLMELDPKQDYREDVEQIEEEIRIDKLYEAELKARLDAYHIRAEDSGTVCSISDMVQYGYVDTTCKNLVSVAYGNDSFTATTNADYAFTEGESFTAQGGGASYPLVLKEVSETGKDADGKPSYELTFVGQEGTDFGAKERLKLVVEKPTLKAVLCIPADCVRRIDGSDYVYMLDENGFRELVSVQCGALEDGRQVILSGLSEGDRVVVP